MSKQILLLAGAALLFAGTVQAEAPGAQTERARTTIAKNEAFVFSASTEIDVASRNCDAISKPDQNEATEELHPDARPVYLNGGHFGGN
ncbi:MAG: hypothetical protein K0M58_05460 [Thiobacillus sp.]|nr:hypothetical protein [Thiobacillus sp.]